MTWKWKYLNPENPVSGPVIYKFTTRGRWATAIGMASASSKVQVRSLGFPWSWKYKSLSTSNLSVYPKNVSQMRLGLTMQTELRALGQLIAHIPIWLKVHKLQKHFQKETVMVSRVVLRFTNFLLKLIFFVAVVQVDTHFLTTNGTPLCPPLQTSLVMSAKVGIVQRLVATRKAS